MKDSYIRKLIEMLENSSLERLDLSTFWSMNKISLSKKTSIVTNLSDFSNEEQTDKPVPKVVNIEKVPKIENVDNQEINKKDDVLSEDINTNSITAPLVGTFYKSSKPGDPAFVKVGDQIKVGQTLCIIEAMKIFNEIDSEVEGKIVEICVDDGSPIEYGQDLFRIQLNDK